MAQHGEFVSVEVADAAVSQPSQAPRGERVTTCAYGCGGEASYRIGKAEKPCCSERFTLCPAYRERASQRQLGESNSFYGKKHTAATKAQMSGDRKGEGNSFWGRTHTEEGKAQISASRMGKAAGPDNPRFGKPRSQATRDKIGETRVRKGLSAGRNNPNWRHGQSGSRKCAMATRRYKKWRESVFVRDDYTCQECGQRGGDLEADHIKAWAYYPELRYAVSNGRTLCVGCHRLTFKSVFRQRDAVLDKAG